MHRETEPLLNDLLARWHCWRVAPARVADSLLGDFDVLVRNVPPKLRTALQVQARNLATGAAVWSTLRDAGNLAEARAYLHNLLGDDESRWFGKQLVYLNERGNRIGESNPRAELTDHEVELMLELREEGKSYGWLADKFEVAKSTAQAICNGSRRGQAPARVKAVVR